MSKEKQKNYRQEVTIIGCGIAGAATAYHLGEKGYKINLIDPNINLEINNLNPNNGTQASLGVLMGNIYKRSKGRSFFLRQKSMKLWQEWLKKINHTELQIKLEQPMIKLANSEKEVQYMIKLLENKKSNGLALLDQKSLNFWNSVFEKKIFGGIVSYHDGRLNPIVLMKLLMNKLKEMNINKINDNVIYIEKNINSLNKNWKIHLKNHPPIEQDCLVICSALNSQKLLEKLGHTIYMEPILGQVVELELEKENDNWKKWPAVLNYQSINFIHYDTLHMQIGATIERGRRPSLICKEDMITIHNSAPKWLKKAKINKEWNGLRARPLKEPSPLLKELEPGLFINTGHYRNGVLLAPASADWIKCKIEKTNFI